MGKHRKDMHLINAGKGEDGLERQGRPSQQRKSAGDGDRKKNAAEKDLITHIRNLTKTMGLGVKQAMDALMISPEDQVKLAGMI